MILGYISVNISIFHLSLLISHDLVSTVASFHQKLYYYYSKCIHVIISSNIITPKAYMSSSVVFSPCIIKRSLVRSWKKTINYYSLFIVQILLLQIVTCLLLFIFLIGTFSAWITSFFFFFWSFESLVFTIIYIIFHLINSHFYTDNKRLKHNFYHMSELKLSTWSSRSGLINKINTIS